MIAFSFIPIVDTQYPRDQIPPAWMLFLIDGNRPANSFPVVDFINCITLATAIRGGIMMTMCTWSSWTLARITSISQSNPSRCIKTFSRYCFTPVTNIFRRYRGVKTIWYSVLYTTWALLRNRMYEIYLVAISPYRLDSLFIPRLQSGALTA